MTSNNTTRKSIAQVESDLRAEMNAGFDRLEALVRKQFGIADEPKASKKGKAKAKASKAKASKATKVTEAPKARFLIQDNRVDFIAAHDWAQPGTSTNELARLVVQEGMPLAKGWEVGPRYRAKFGEEVVTATPKAAPNKAKKGKKAKGRQVIASIEAKRGARMSAEWIKQAHPSDGPRNGKGQATPKSTWVQRDALEQQGYTPKQIDLILG